ncbi:pseudaminic acid cytidylyltransferase [Mesorhizobium sp. IMUNJ 23232]|uniref:pseudaminic acid cytidylyltransferase n=1 Tax=Mesorhizobium sp. IMUNJ 23232 TaxID=3376064 RepID=UPI0037901E61
MRVAVIPARGGSKRVPRKNVRVFAGKPMIAWAIKAAADSGVFDHILVSTDDVEIRDVAVAAGAEAPFLRPAELSDDHTGTRKVIQHAIHEAERAFGPVDAACCIYATAAFVEPDDLRHGLERLTADGRQFAFSATAYAYPIQRALRRAANGGVEMCQPEHRLTRTQDLEEVFHDAGQFYWGKRDAFLSDEPMFGLQAAPVMIPNWRVHDIDNEDDWKRAEMMFSALGKGAAG